MFSVISKDTISNGLISFWQFYRWLFCNYCFVCLNVEEESEEEAETGTETRTEREEEEVEAVYVFHSSLWDTCCCCVRVKEEKRRWKIIKIQSENEKTLYHIYSLWTKRKENYLNSQEKTRKYILPDKHYWKVLTIK